MKQSTSLSRTLVISKDNSESADPAALCDWCDHPSGYLPPVLDKGEWIHFGRDGDGQICTAPLCELCKHPWTFSYGEEGSHDNDGRCYFPIGPNASGGQRSCYCKCVFPITQDTASPKERNSTTVPGHDVVGSGLNGKSDVERIIDWLEHRCDYAPPCGKCTYCVIARTIPWFDSGRAPESESSISSKLAEIRAAWPVKRRTHWEGCYAVNGHHACAINVLGSIVDSLQAEKDAAVAKLDFEYQHPQGLRSLYNFVLKERDALRDAASNMKAELVKRVREKNLPCTCQTPFRYEGGVRKHQAYCIVGVRDELATELEAVELNGNSDPYPCPNCNAPDTVNLAIPPEVSIGCRECGWEAVPSARALSQEEAAAWRELYEQQ